MFTRRSLLCAVTLLVLCVVLVPEARAEVAVETDAFGRYVRTLIFTQSSLRAVKIWRQLRRNIGSIHPLNPTGDRLGDQFPFVAENPKDGRFPVAVWSRFNGVDFDLVWSRWQAGHWTSVEWITTGSAGGDDVKPFLTFDLAGRPYLTWWRDENGVGAVYMSYFLVTRWLTPVRISDVGMDSRNPRINPINASQMLVDYQVPGGIESRVVTYTGPTTITDDLDPVSHVSVNPSISQRSTWP